MRVEGLGKLIKLNYPIGSRTRDLAACTILSFFVFQVLVSETFPHQTHLHIALRHKVAKALCSNKATVVRVYELQGPSASVRSSPSIIRVLRVIIRSSAETRELELKKNLLKLPAGQTGLQGMNKSTCRQVTLRILMSEWCSLCNRVT
jgi:hypothetical protein